MSQLTDKDKEICLITWHDILIWEIDVLEGKFINPNELNYQMEILEKENPTLFAKKIKEIRRKHNSVLKKWENNQKKVEILKEELAVYKKYLQKM